MLHVRTPSFPTRLASDRHDHSPKYGKTFTMPFNYVPERAGEAHKWLRYLEDAWGDDHDYVEKVMALQEAFAATMFGIAPRFQRAIRSEEHTSELQSLMRISYAVFCLKKKKTQTQK